MSISRIIGKGFNYAGRVFTKLGGKCDKAASRYCKPPVDIPVTESVAKKVYTGPTLSEIVAKQPKALPAPNAKQLAADVPQLNTSKIYGLNMDELSMSQVITKDGTHVRYFRRRGDNNILLKMTDKGLLHTERVYGYTPGDITFLKTVGDDMYLLRKSGDKTQIIKQSVKYKDGIDQTLRREELYEVGLSRQMKKVVDNKFNGEVERNVTFNTQSVNNAPLSLTANLNERGGFASKISSNGRYLTSTDVYYTVGEDNYMAFKNFCENKTNFIDDVMGAFKE